MSVPGTRLRSLARRVSSAQTMEGLIDPVIADQQHEYADAVRRGDVWGGRYARLAGCVAFWKVAVMVTARASVRPVSMSDAGSLGRTIRFAGLATIVITAVFVWVPLRQTLAILHLGNDSLIRLTLYLVPQALAVAIPLGLAFGMLSGGVRSRRSKHVSLSLMFGASLTELLLGGWLMPAGNQAYRETMFALINGVDGHLLRGVNELTLGDLRAKDTYQFHFRLALAAAPLFLGLFSLALATLFRRTRSFSAGGITLAIGFIYYVLIDWSRGQARYAHLPSAVAAWTPNLLFAASALLLFVRTHARSAADPSRLDDDPRSADQPAIPPA